MSDTASSFGSCKICLDSKCQHNTEVSNDHRIQQETTPPLDNTAVLAVSESQAAVSLEPPEYRRKTRSYSLGDDINDPRGFFREKHAKNLKVEMRRITQTLTNESQVQDTFFKSQRRPSGVAVDMEADSHASKALQETEKDVCFPVSQDRVRVNGIDFDEIENFIREERENQRFVKPQVPSMGGVTLENTPRGLPSAEHTFTAPHKGNKPSKNAMRYSPRNILKGSSNAFSKSVKDDKVSQDISCHPASDNLPYSEKNDGSPDQKLFGRNECALELPYRYSFFHSENAETVHSPDIPSLTRPGESISDLFKNGTGTWWLDCTCPTDAEMKTLAKAFGLHPLTAEDIRMQEPREKVELFRDYYLMSFHTFDQDIESNSYLQPIHVYIVVFSEGVLTFHFSPASHPANVRRRVRQLRGHVTVSADWLGYALIDDITDGFAPVIADIQYEADAIEDSVFDFSPVQVKLMLKRICDSRKQVMTLMRLLSNKADVIGMFAKRYQDEQWAPPAHTTGSTVDSSGPKTPPGTSRMMSQTPPKYIQPKADIALYLGDIQDHVVTMFQNLSAYEKIFSRSHTNSLAKLRVESFNAHLNWTRIMGNVTILASMSLPLHVITGLFGMNVNVPGDGEDYWFWGIVGFLVLMVVLAAIGAKFYVRNLKRRQLESQESGRIITFASLNNKKRYDAKSTVSHLNSYD